MQQHEQATETHPQGMLASYIKQNLESGRTEAVPFSSFGYIRSDDWSAALNRGEDLGLWMLECMPALDNQWVVRVHMEAYN